MMNEQWPLGRKSSVDVNLDHVSTLLLKADVRKERHVVGITIRLDGKLGWCRHDEFLPVW